MLNAAASLQMTWKAIQHSKPQEEMFVLVTAAVVMFHSNDTFTGTLFSLLQQFVFVQHRIAFI